MHKQSGKAGIWVILLVIVVVLLVVFMGDKKARSINEYRVTIENVSEDQVLSPGVYVLHSPEASLNFEGSLAPESLEPLAEYGDHAPFAAFVETVPGVLAVYRVNAPIKPGEMSQFVAMIPEDAEEPYYLSGLQMAVGTNDGYALVNNLELTGREASINALNYDAGTEENTELLSGFPGGQPDPSRGEENIENGTSTDPRANVTRHPQLSSTIMAVTVSPIEEIPAAE